MPTPYIIEINLIRIPRFPYIQMILNWDLLPRIEPYPEKDM